MKKNRSHSRARFLLIVAIVAMIGMMSCQDNDVKHNDEELQTQATSSVETAHNIVVNLQEVVDLTSNVLSSEGISIEGSNAAPESCSPTINRQYAMDFSHYDTIIYAGTITLEYGNGNNCPDGTKREGSIENVFTYIINNLNGTSSSVKQAISFHNFKRNNMQIDGRIRTTAATGFADTLEVVEATTTSETGESTNWSGTLANQLIKSGDIIGNGDGNTHILTGTFYSSTIDGKFFTGNILKAIRSSYACSGSDSLIPVSGTIEIKLNGNSFVLDYGDGTCDGNYTVTINNNVKSYSF